MYNMYIYYVIRSRNWHDLDWYNDIILQAYTKFLSYLHFWNLKTSPAICSLKLQAKACPLGVYGIAKLVLVGKRKWLKANMNSLNVARTKSSM